MKNKIKDSREEKKTIAEISQPSEQEEMNKQISTNINFAWRASWRLMQDWNQTDKRKQIVRSKNIYLVTDGNGSEQLMM